MSETEPSDNEDAEEPVTIVKEVKAADKIKVLAQIELSESDNEEEETQTLTAIELNEPDSLQRCDMSNFCPVGFTKLTRYRNRVNIGRSRLMATP